jgi:hypothetical protein
MSQTGQDTPYGLIPVGHLLGAPWTGKFRTYQIASGYNQNLFIGSPVAPAANGTVTIATSASATNPILGVVTGVKYLMAGSAQSNASNSYPYYPASQTIASGTIIQVEVVDDPYVIFQIATTGAGASAGIELTGNFANYNLTAIGTGNTATGQSTCGLLNTPVTAALADLKVIGAPTYDMNANPSWSASSSKPFNDVLVVINNHFYKAPTVGV